ncbi:MAG TPA: metal ABC transporter permease [Capillimicrobium sp.]|nr:metal ABC transporter permease [Capillimicrobium sp.]
MDRLIDLIPLPYTDAVVALGALVLGVVAGVLGVVAVLRERSLVGDALSHAALPGVCVAFLLTGVKEAGGLLAGAACAGIVAAVCIVLIERGGRIRSDAAIGVVLSSAFSLGIVLLTAISNRHDADQAGLERYLFGQAAGLSEHDVVVTGALGLAGLLLVAVGFRALKTALFDADYAAAAGLPVRALDVGMTALLVIAVVVGVRMVGAILMVAMLVSPAVAARQLTDRLSRLLPLAGVLGAAIGVAGALLSAREELPTGPTIVLVGFAVVVASIAFAPGRGVLWSAAQLRRDRRRALVESVLVDLATALEAGPPPTEAELCDLSPRPPRELRRGVRALDRAGLLGRDGDRLRLTEAGAAAARRQLARRDEWSLWLEHGWRLRLPDAREPDPRDLERSIGPEAMAELRALAR